VRAVWRNFAVRTRRQFSQEQFHCGNPPPAAEPKILTRMTSLPRRGE
jgi:hypothetical protein